MTKIEKSFDKVKKEINNLRYGMYLYGITLIGILIYLIKVGGN